MPVGLLDLIRNPRIFLTRDSKFTLKPLFQTIFWRLICVSLLTVLSLCGQPPRLG